MTEWDSTWEFMRIVYQVLVISTGLVLFLGIASRSYLGLTLDLILIVIETGIWGFLSLVGLGLSIVVDN